MQAAHLLPIVSTLRAPASVMEARYTRWRGWVEEFKTVHGFRAVLSHVPEEVWARHFAANEDGFSAVVAEAQNLAT